MRRLVWCGVARRARLTIPRRGRKIDVLIADMAACRGPRENPRPRRGEAGGPLDEDPVRQCAAPMRALTFTGRRAVEPSIMDTAGLEAWAARPGNRRGAKSRFFGTPISAAIEIGDLAGILR